MCRGLNHHDLWSVVRPCLVAIKRATEEDLITQAQSM